MSEELIPSTQNLDILAPWLIEQSLPTEIDRLIKRSLCDVGILENPPSSNRGKRIDYYNTLCRVPLGSSYCAAALTGWTDYAGAWHPSTLASWWTSKGLAVGNPASVSDWIRAAKDEGRWTSTPALGRAVVYGNKLDQGTHIGLLIRSPDLEQLLYRSFEANTSTNPGYSREGGGFEMKWQTEDQRKRVTGYIILSKNI